MVKKEKIKILHITAHLGGGVGTVVGGYLKRTNKCNDFSHSVICLDYINPYSREVLKKQEIEFEENVGTNISLIYNKIKESDIILIHWWNHPLIFNFLLDQNLPDCRMIIWSHVSGLFPPDVFSEKLISLPDLFVFTSPISFKAKEITNLSNSLRKKIRTIWSVGENEHLYDLVKISHDNFNVGLTGTVDKSKLHFKYIDMCNDVNIKEVKFIVCSGDSQERLKIEASEKGILEKFDFMGRVESIVPYLQIFDVFGYPLQPHHFGTCEQSLGEAMLAGVVPVVLNNPTENLIIEDGKDGIIAKSPSEYSRAIEYLKENSEKRNLLSNNAIISAKKRYSLNKTVEAWENAFDECLHNPKTKKQWKTFNHLLSGNEVFLASLGNNVTVFEEYKNALNLEADLSSSIEKIRIFFESNIIWKSKNKGSIQQYLKFFPNDKLLQNWSEI